MKITLSNSEYNFIKINYKKYLKDIFNNNFINELNNELENLNYYAIPDTENRKLKIKSIINKLKAIK